MRYLVRVFAMISLLLSAGVLWPMSTSQASAGLVFDVSPGSGPPPSTLGGYTMTPFASDSTPLGAYESSVPSPTGGTIQFSPQLQHIQARRGSATWRNGYTGDAYWNPPGSGDITLTLPAGTTAFYLYVKSNTSSEFQAYAQGASATDSAYEDVGMGLSGSAGATYLGLYGDGVPISSITLSCTCDYVIGEFGISGGAGTPNVTISKTASLAVNAGSNISYQISYQNSGTTSATSVSISDSLPSGTSYVSGSASPAPSTVSGNTLTWNLGPLAATASGSISFQAATAPSSVNQTVNNCATVAFNDGSGAQRSSQSCASTRLQPPSTGPQRSTIVLKASSGPLTNTTEVDVMASLTPQGTDYHLNYIWFQVFEPGARCSGFAKPEASIIRNGKAVWSGTGSEILFGPGITSDTKSEYVFLYNTPPVHARSGDYIQIDYATDYTSIIANNQDGTPNPCGNPEDETGSLRLTIP